MKLSRRAARREVVHLGFGEASYPLYPLLRAALAEATTQTSYAPMQGFPELRQAIAEGEFATSLQPAFLLPLRVQARS